jgi:hypothetical protein
MQSRVACGAVHLAWLLRRPPGAAPTRAHWPRPRDGCAELADCCGERGVMTVACISAGGGERPPPRNCHGNYVICCGGASLIMI